MASSSKEASASPQNPTPSSDETPSSIPFNFNLGSDGPTVPSRSARSRPRLVKHRKQQARSRTGPAPELNPVNSGDFNELESVGKTDANLREGGTGIGSEAEGRSYSGVGFVFGSSGVDPSSCLNLEKNDSFRLESSREFQKMAEARTGCVAIIRWIWSQVKRPFSYMVESSPDSQVAGNMDASTSLPRLPAVVPLNQETMVVPADQINEALVLFEPTSSSCLPSSPDSHVLGDLDASASLPSSSSKSEWKYDVFLSFRGPDTRKGITIDIYDGLNRRGIRTFMDDPDLQVGDAISPTLITAIKKSRFAIVVLSQNYAFSAWCLEELREICQSMEDNRILPLFYNVDPTDVRYQKHSFRDAFTHHEKKKKETSGRHKSETMKQWRDALNKVANFSGWNTQQYKTHKELVNVIVEFVCTKVVPDAIESTGDFEVFEATRQALDEVRNALKDDEVSTVGVYGMGGVGKTTLVEHVAAQAQKSGIFDHVTKWVVSQNPAFKNLQDTLAEQLGIRLDENTEIARAARLRKEIKRREKILLILDDIWEKLDLSTIGIPSNQELQKCNSKVLLTTRRLHVCHQMECQRKIALNVLSEQDSWALFVRKARRSFESPTFEDVAKKVAKECKGLPIALITVARALGDKDLAEWKRAAQRLMKSQTANPDDDGEAYKCIKLSYDYLKEQEYKSFFLLCCLFPEDSEIKITDLFKYAIGKGLFGDADTLQEARERAETLAGHLQDSCLLLKGKYRDIMMHDVVRDAAIQIAQSEGGILVKAGCGLEDWPRLSHEGYSAISLTGNDIRKLPEKLVCPKLQILLLNDNPSIETIPEAFFQSPNELRVLDLGRTDEFGASILSLPQSFSLLTKLQALYLDGCKITDTSVLGKFRRLEILSMRGTELKELSIEVGGLTNLRIFDNTYGEIERIPPGVISKLHSLEELYIEGFSDWGREVEGDGEETNACFREVTTLSKLRVLTVTIFDAGSIPKYVEFIPNWVKFYIEIGYRYEMEGYDEAEFGNQICLDLNKISLLPKWFSNEIMKMAERLEWSGCERLIDIFVESEHGRLQRLKYLRVEGDFGPVDREELENLGGFTEVDPTITWVPKTPVFENLEELELDRLDCAELCAVDFLPPGSLFNLKVLRVCYCYNWGDILLPSTLLQRLPNLEKLHFGYTHGGKYMFGYEALLVLRELKLKKINLFGLDIVSICDGPAPPVMLQNLQSLSIGYCKRLQGSLFSYDVAQCLSQLNSLDLHDCPLLERIVEASNTKTILPKLKQLSLKKLPMLYYESATFDIECPSLEELSLWGCPKLCAVDFLPPGSLFNLKVLRVRFCYNWGDILLPSTLLQRLPNLEELLFDSTDGGEYMFGYEALLVLRELKLKKINLSGLDIVSICDGPAPPAMLQNLQSLSIDRCKQLQGSLFSYDVAQCLSQLNSLSIYTCPLLERIVEASNKKTIFRKLEFLRLSSLPMLYYKSATFDIECPSLKQFSSWNCPKYAASCSDFLSWKQVLRKRFMDNNNGNSSQGGEPAMEAEDWRSQLKAESRQRIVNKIMETLKRHLPFSGQEGLIELQKIAVRFEEKIYAAATSPLDYLRKISVKMLTVETKYQNTMANSLQSNAAGSSVMQPQVNNQGQFLSIENVQSNFPPAGFQFSAPNQGQSLSRPRPANQSQARQHLLSQNIQNNIPPAGVQSSAGLSSALPPASGLTQTHIPSMVGQNANLQSMSGTSQNSLGNSMCQGVASNMSANSQRPMPGRQQVVPQQQQQRPQNSQQYMYQSQQQLMKPNFKT